MYYDTLWGINDTLCDVGVDDTLGASGCGVDDDKVVYVSVAVALTVLIVVNGQ